MLEPMPAIIARHAVMQASQACAHMAHVALMSECILHSVMHASHMAMHAWSMAVIAPISMPAGRIIMRIVVMQTSAHIAQRDAQTPMPSMAPMASAHIVHACIAVEQASMASCIIIMSMPSGIVMSRIIMVVDSIMRSSPSPHTDVPPAPGDVVPSAALGPQ